MEQAVILQHV